MGKFKMPTVNQFYEQKFIYDQPKKDPVWVYLEREMLANSANKPYNRKVGKWLRFLRDLKYHYYCESKRQLRILEKERGPCWYIEFSNYQKNLLVYLKQNIKQDIIEGLPVRTRQCLYDLGITIFIPNSILFKAMLSSVDDQGIFIWNLYTAIYQKTPSELRGEYDMNAMILMSALVFVDLDECIERLEKLTAPTTKPALMPPKKKKKKKYFEPEVKFGVYLQKMHAPIYCNYSTKSQLGRVKPPRPMDYKIKLRNKRMELRLERNKKEKISERICNYKFWAPPRALRKKTTGKANMLTEIPKAKHFFHFKNIKSNVGTVAYVKGEPVYLINCVCVLPTAYVLINGGVSRLPSGEYGPLLMGHWIKFTEAEVKCVSSQCSCIKWEPAVMKYLHDYKCRCDHLYDEFSKEGNAQETYFYPPTKNTTFYIDKPKIFQFDPLDEFIKDTVRMAVQSQEPTPTASLPSVSATGLKDSVLLATFLADLSGTPLIIPHLPQASKLNNLLEWVRNRVKGKITPKSHRTFTLRSLRRWLWLKHMDFRRRAYRIPFTKPQLRRMNWSHRWQVQTLYKMMLNNFVTRNRLRQIEQTRLWFSTMKYDTYPAKAFLDIYFTYMPGRMRDTYIFNPHCKERTPTHCAQTCPLRLQSLIRVNV